MDDTQRVGRRRCELWSLAASRSLEGDSALQSWSLHTLVDQQRCRQREWWEACHSQSGLPMPHGTEHPADQRSVKVNDFVPTIPVRHLTPYPFDQVNYRRRLQLRVGESLIRVLPPWISNSAILELNQNSGYGRTERRLIF